MEILSFVHIPKTAGTFLNHILRSWYGIRHVDLLAIRHGHDVAPSWDNALSATELRDSIRINPAPLSLSGHYLLPTQELRDSIPTARWFTIFRDPVKRLISDYRHKCQLLETLVPFEEWVPKRTNIQIKLLVGTDRASDLITRVQAGDMVVLDQRFLSDELTRFFGLDEGRKAWLESMPPKNVRHGTDLDEKIEQYLSQFDLMEHVREEQIFHDWLQAERFRGNPREITVSPPPGSGWFSLNRQTNRLYRNLVYKPIYRMSH